MPRPGMRQLRLTKILCINMLMSTHSWITAPTRRSFTRRFTAAIDWQDDTSRFERGEQHLSAVLQEGDVLLYQGGMWFVDGVEVGDDPPFWEYLKVETIQIVWTHNCEHGVIRGFPMKTSTEEDEFWEVEQEGDLVEVGPEQLVARMPVVWDDDGVAVGGLLSLDHPDIQCHAMLLSEEEIQ